MLNNFEGVLELKVIQGDLSPPVLGSVAISLAWAIASCSCGPQAKELPTLIATELMTRGEMCHPIKCNASCHLLLSGHYSFDSHPMLAKYSAF